MYGPLLLIHSWTRWIVLIAAIYFLFKSAYGWLSKKPVSPADNKFLWAFDQVLNYQVLFGLAIYIAASPMVRAAIAAPSEILSNPVIQFWTLRHPITMLAVIAVFQIGKGRGVRAESSKRYQIYCLTFAAVLLLIVSAIPWEGLTYGRPFFRWSI